MKTSRRDSLIPRNFISTMALQVLSRSERQILGKIFRQQGCTQAELTNSSPLSQQSISRLTNALIERGLINKGERQQSGTRGQPSVPMNINSDYAYSVGISLMTDGIELSITNFAGEQIAECSPRCENMKRELVLDIAYRKTEEMLKSSGIDRSRLFGIGIATTGFRVGRGAKFNTPPALNDFALIDLEEVFAERWSLPVWADNDGNAATIAENMNGVGRRVRNFAYFYIATGVGGGIVIDGKLMYGNHGNAGEFVGILPIDSFPYPNLELLRKHVNAHGKNFESVGTLVHQYDDNWQGIDEWIEEAAPSLSLMASATSAVLDTELIVLGGKIPTDLAKRVASKIKFFDIQRRGVAREHASIVPPECKGNATVIGASLLPFVDQFFEFV